MKPDYENFPNWLSKALTMDGSINAVLSAFQKLPSHLEKVRFSYNLTDKYDLLPKNIVSKKDAAKAAEARNRGNQLFVSGDFLNALEQYNRSLCLSVNGSENMGLTYANRSAVYFRTRFYEACLENIQLALKNGYPEKMEEKLLKRKEDCLLEINNGKGRQMEPEEMDVQLSYKANPKFPVMVEGIELVKNEQYGNHFIAKKSFNPGDVLMVEKPLILTLDREKVYTYCLFCLKSNLLNLMPCKESTYAMFCSQKCYDEAKEKFFKYEGPILDAVYVLLKEKLIVIRLIMKLVTHFGNLDDLIEKFDSLPKENFDPRSIDLINSTEKDLLLLYCAYSTFENVRASLVLGYAEDLRPFKYANWSAYAFYLIKNYSGLGQLIKTQDHENFLMQVLYRLCFIVTAYDHYYYCAAPKHSEGKILKGSGVNLFADLINHSCAPNVLRAGENKDFIVVMRPIKAGHQLFMSYGPHHLLDTRLERQKMLKYFRYFNCTCVACKNDYPTLENSTATLKPNLSSELFQSYLKVPPLSALAVKPFDREMMKNALKKYKDFLKKYDQLYPQALVCMVASAQKETMIKFYLNKPLEMAL